MIKTVYISMFQSMGDVILTTSIVHSLKEKYKEAKITFAVGEQYAELLNGNPEIDEIIKIRHPWEGILRSTEKKYDLVCLPLMKDNGSDVAWHQLPDFCMPEKELHMVDMYAEKCNADIKITDRRVFVYPSDEDWDKMVNALPPETKDKFINAKYITVHTTSLLDTKDWPYEKWNELCKLIHGKYGDKIEIRQVGGKDDKPLNSPVVCLNGTPLMSTAHILKRSLLHIGGDSGTEHLCNCFSTPIICIMGSSSSYNNGIINRKEATFIEPSQRECLNKGRHCPCVSHCEIESPCINTVSVEEVFNVVSEKLDKILG